MPHKKGLQGGGSLRSKSVIRASMFIVLGAGTALLTACETDGPAATRDYANNVVIADFNGDGAADIAVVFTRGQGEIFTGPLFAGVMLQNSAAPGTFKPSVDSAVTANSSLTALAVADVDGRNGPDLLVADLRTGNMLLLAQDVSGAGRLQTPTITTIGGEPLDLAVGDLNNDGMVDVAVADGSSNPSARVLFQNANAPGQFLAPLTIATGLSSGAIAVGDLNGDGLGDVVVAESATNGAPQLAVFYHDPIVNDAFLPRVNFPIGVQAAAVKIVDVNGDGAADVLVLTYRTVEVHLQDPVHAGNFFATTSYAASYGMSFAVGDFDGDGHLDIAVAGPGSVSVLLQDASQPGVFLAAQQYEGTFVTHGRSIDVGDLNGDGLLDIAVANGERAKVLFNSPSRPGTFGTAVAVGR